MKIKRTALITGISGQDGSYLAELLLDKGYEVHGIIREESSGNINDLWRLQEIKGRIILHKGSICDYTFLKHVVIAIVPDECYHFAAQSFVSYSFDDEAVTLETNINGTLHMLAALRDFSPGCKFYFAGSSEMFGLAQRSPQDETDRFNPRSLYGISKAAGFHLTHNFRHSYGMFACNGILYNHESPRRADIFVTRKITRAIARIRAGKQKELRLGNLDAMRDWGYAKDYVRAVWLMMQQDTPDDYIIATGVLHSVKDFVKIAFSYADLDWEKYVVVAPEFYRPGEEFPLCGNALKARSKLGWEPTVSFEELVRMMVQSDLKAI